MQIAARAAKDVDPTILCTGDEPCGVYLADSCMIVPRYLSRYMYRIGGTLNSTMSDGYPD